MTLDEARKSVRYAYITAFACAFWLLLWFSSNLILPDSHITSGQYSAVLFSGIVIALVTLYVICGITIYRYSRAGSIIAFALLVSNTAIEIRDHGFQNLLTLAVYITFTYFFWRGIKGTFAYHRLRKESDAIYKASSVWSYVLWIPVFMIVLPIILFPLITTSYVEKHPSKQLIKDTEEKQLKEIEMKTLNSDRIPSPTTDVSQVYVGSDVKLEKTYTSEETIDLNTQEFKYISYLTNFKRMVYDVWEYPEESRIRNEEGKVLLMITINNKGYLEDVKLIDSSGSSTLDKTAIRTIELASPFNPFPEIWGLERINIRVPFEYKISKSDSASEEPIYELGERANKIGAIDVEDELKKTPNEIYSQSINSVITIHTYDYEGNLIGSGSGFYYTEYLIATNFHVIEGANIIKIKYYGHEIPMTITEIVYVSDIFDLALLKSKIKGIPLAVGTIENLSPGTRVFAIGSPFGLEGTISDGIISAVRELEEVKILQITNNISGGSSGGPLFNEQGKVIGVTSAYIPGAQNLNFAIPAAYLKMVSDRPMDLIDYMNRGVTRHRLGDYNGAIEDYNAAIDINPNNALAHYNKGVAFLSYNNIFDRLIGCRHLSKSAKLGMDKANELIDKYCE